MIRTETLSIPSPILLRPDVTRDARGFFAETLRADVLTQAGIDEDFVQDSQSRSLRNTIRGLHFQEGLGQAKLVRVAHGAILDVAVDIRPASATFGRHVSMRLDDDELYALYIPRGFAHGFCVLSDTADILYRVSPYYDPALERGIAWDDPALGIDWPTQAPLVSPRDSRHPPLSELNLTQPAGCRLLRAGGYRRGASAGIPPSGAADMRCPSVARAGEQAEGST